MKTKHWLGWAVIFAVLLVLFVEASNRSSVALAVGSLFLGAIIATAYERYLERIGEVIVDERVKVIEEKSYALTMRVLGFTIALTFVSTSIISQRDPFWKSASITSGLFLAIIALLPLFAKAHYEEVM
ncbi:DUF2178 domain-containing protein [Thermococcus sp. Bubb.Bath]|uniref:DUF2178 domain-containing protein n=1 Tax=Thermococcus sp. Bubb.Bath TaxID=1638242 RepID=UPI001439C9D2|nr:DUF2178 domain-containing protein [Thermococcus sp. Bubb.Bath]NJF24725.1 DUF2178 domain-containing protein [Thermococcus sp. Bubb.Bath]